LRRVHRTIHDPLLSSHVRWSVHRHVARNPEPSAIRNAPTPCVSPGSHHAPSSDLRDGVRMPQHVVHLAGQGCLAVDFRGVSQSARDECKTDMVTRRSHQLSSHINHAQREGRVLAATKPNRICEGALSPRSVVWCTGQDTLG
jgi:hypothetical protein